MSSPIVQGARPLEASDARTLSYATPPLTAELLARWGKGQEAFLSRLESPEGASEEERLAGAHREALEASGLSTQVASQVETVVRAFCGVVQTAEVLRRKVEALEQANPPGEGAHEQITRVRREQERLMELTPLRQRHGDEAVAVLLEQRDRLLGLHLRWCRALGR
ncbi:MAG TPA: hypothetical protein VK013_17360 [Myxococcaceae bacterium]|nr:hypothetical protein [Myxococcaceae bacterium]